MSLVTQLQSLITRLGTEFKAVRNSVGPLVNLTTDNKSSIVLAINELDAAIASFSGINDAAVSTGTSYSSQKTVDLLVALKAEILGGAGAAFDTLQELKALIDAEGGELDALVTAVGNRVRFDAAQTLDTTQKAQALANIGAISAADVGDVTTDFVAAFNTAIA